MNEKKNREIGEAREGVELKERMPIRPIGQRGNSLFVNIRFNCLCEHEERVI